MNKGNANEPAIDRCMQVALCVRVVEQSEDAENCSEASRYNLCGKPSFFVCKGKKSPNLNEVDSDTDLRQLQPNGFSYEDTSMRVQDIIECQQHIIRMVEGAKEKIIDEKYTK